MMTQEDKQLLLKDICARLAFGRVKCQVKVVSFNEEMDVHIELLDDEITFIEPDIYNVYLYKEGTDVDISDIKPYLRPMSSMTEEEIKEFRAFHCVDGLHPYFYQQMCNLQNLENMFNWLNTHHFDYRGLIVKGLALEAPEGMYKTKLN